MISWRETAFQRSGSEMGHRQERDAVQHPAIQAEEGVAMEGAVVVGLDCVHDGWFVWISLHRCGRAERFSPDHPHDMEQRVIEIDV